MRRNRSRPSVGIFAAIPLVVASLSSQLHTAHAIDGVPAFPAGLGGLHHPIATANRDAQQLFDQALTMYYGFNRDAARRTFERAAALDARAAMPRAGIALALGPNLNMDSTADDVRNACSAARTAVTLAIDATERAYANALRTRYCAKDGQVDAAGYTLAMRAVSREAVDDVDAAVMYADSLLQLRPRTPEQERELIAVLEAALRKAPAHVGANHFYIHAVEGSDAPARALESAKRLETLVPGIGHLLHMPSHIYMRTGDYDAAIRANGRGVAADFWYLQHNPPGHDGAMSYLHDLESLSVADAFAGRSADARSAAREIARVEAGLADDTTPNRFSAPLAFALLRFQAWTDVLSLSVPPPADPFASMVSAFARASALGAVNRLPEAGTEQQRFERSVAALPAAMYRGNPAARVTDVFRAVLAARLRQAQRGPAAAIADWQKAVAAQDQLEYHEPPPFYYPVRESLGAALLAASRIGEAERAFRDDLSKNPGNGRSLYGLWRTLVAAHRDADARDAAAAFRAAWEHADVQLSLTVF